MMVLLGGIAGGDRSFRPGHFSYIHILSLVVLILDPILTITRHHIPGITQESDISGPNASPIVPDYVTNSIGDLLAVLSS